MKAIPDFPSAIDSTHSIQTPIARDLAIDRMTEQERATWVRCLARIMLNQALKEWDQELTRDLSGAVE